MEFKQVVTKADIAEFHRLPAEIYANDPLYIQPLITDIESIFNPKINDTWNRGKAERFIIIEKNKTVARFAVFYVKNAEGLLGGLGFFECIDKQEIANAIFNYACDWCKTAGCKKIQAPVNFGDRDSFWGLLVSISNYPSYRENYQPTYYKSLFENFGWELEIEQSTYDIEESQFNFERFNKLAQRVLQNNKYEFKTMQFNELTKYAQDFVEIYNQAWESFEDFRPITIDKILKRFKQVKQVSREPFMIFAYAEGKPIGFYLSILEINQLLKNVNGKLTLWNKIWLLMNLKKINKVRGIIFGVIPQYHNLGIETGMIMKFHESITAQNEIKIAELAWVGSFNNKMLSMLESLGATKTKLHHTYKKDL